MTKKRILLFSQPGRPPCDWARAFLSERGVAYELRDVSCDPSAVRELVRYKSRATPTIVVGEEIMIGFDPERLEKMIAE